MKIVNVTNSDLPPAPRGDRFKVLVDRHEKHGGFLHHTIALVEVPPGGSSDPHLHREREESYLVVAGGGIVTVGAERSPVIAGDLVSAAPGEPHKFDNTGCAPLRYLVITAPSWVPSDSWPAD